MASKSAKQKLKLPIFQQEASFQIEVDKWKKQYRNDKLNSGINGYASRLANHRARKDYLEEEISVLNAQIEACSQLGSELMIANQQDSTKLSSGATVYLSYDVYPKVVDKQKLIAWAKEHGMEESFTLPWQTLRGMCNELDANGNPLPNGVEGYTKISLRILNRKDIPVNSPEVKELSHSKTESK